MLESSPPQVRTLSFASPDPLAVLYGEGNGNLKELERLLEVRVHARGSEVRITGQDEEGVHLAERVLSELYDLIWKGYPVFLDDIGHAVRVLSQNERVHLTDIFLDTVFISAQKRLITPKSLNQKRYIDAIRCHDIVFGIGVAGTGKTYLAMAMAVSALTKKEAHRIILTRPAVEAGEKLGFLPGDLQDKVNPYLRPLYDALHDMMDYEKAIRLVERGAIEVAPLAFMRGRTLNDSFVILDEAQNTTSEQMKMFLTRLGVGSKAVITGDVTQVDLPQGKVSGLVEVQEILKGIEGMSFVYFGPQDVVRHRLVQDIVHAYERAEAGRKAAVEDRAPAPGQS